VEEVEREVCLMMAPESIIRAWYFLGEESFLLLLKLPLLLLGVA